MIFKGECDNTEKQYLESKFSTNTGLTKNPYEKEKIGIWCMIFGGKKDKTFLKKKNNCDCSTRKKMKNKATQSDLGIRNQHNNNKIISPPLNSSKEPETRANETNGNPTQYKEGFGFHLYLCINKPIQAVLKAKGLKPKNNDNIIKPCPRCSLNISESLDNKLRPEITIMCDTSNESTLEQTQQTHIMKQSDEYTVKSVGSVGTNLDSSISSINPSLTPINTEALYQIQSKHIDFQKLDKLQGEDIKNKFEENTEKSTPTTEFKLKPESDYVDTNYDSKIIPIGLQGFENNIKSLAVAPVGFLCDKIPSNRRRSSDTTVIDQDDEKILNEYENYRKATKIRKSTVKGGGMSLRNSEFKRQRQTLQLDFNVSTILKKLNSIEEKLEELQRKNGTKNIIMDVSCDKGESCMAIQFKNQSNNKKLKDPNTGMTPSKKKDIYKIVEGNSHKESDLVNSSTKDAVVKGKESISSAKNIVFHNLFEMDAHTLGCNSRTISCTNPKIIIECPKIKQACKSFKNEPSDKWRRISEELKISNPDFKCCVNCTCNVCLCNK